MKGKRETWHGWQAVHGASLQCMKKATCVRSFYAYIYIYYICVCVWLRSEGAWKCEKFSQQSDKNWRNVIWVCWVVEPQPKTLHCPCIILAPISFFFFFIRNTISCSMLCLHYTLSSLLLYLFYSFFCLDYKSLQHRIYHFSFVLVVYSLYNMCMSNSVGSEFFKI